MIALVTGGTAGIGREIAGKLRTAGFTLLITGRDQSRGAAAATDLDATFLPADHATIAGNLDLARRLRERVPRLDALINNVGGAAFAERTHTGEGHEAILALNYLGPVTLTHALLPTLSAHARVVQVVSSAFTMHRSGCATRRCRTAPGKPPSTSPKRPTTPSSPRARSDPATTLLRADTDPDS